MEDIDAATVKRKSNEKTDSTSDEKSKAEKEAEEKDRKQKEDDTVSKVTLSGLLNAIVSRRFRLSCCVIVPTSEPD